MPTAIPLSSEMMDDQREALAEEYDVSEDEVEELYKSMKTNVMLMSQEAGRDWGEDEYEAVTDVLMAIQYQQMRVMEQMQDSRAASLARHLPSILLGATAFGLTISVSGLLSGPVTAEILGLISISLVTMTSWLTLR